MNQSDPHTSPNRRLHPLIATAAGGLIVASLAATAAITGVFPKASGTPALNAQTQSGETAGVTPPAPVTQPAQLAQNGTTMAQQPPVESAGQPPQYAPTPQQYAGAAQPPMTTACTSCGTVTGVSAVKHAGHATGIGAVGGAVVGGVVGNQFGAGVGRVGMTLLGALGGGVAGNAVEKHLRSTASYSVRVHMENGRTRYFSYRAAPPFHQGEHVRIEHGTLVAA